MVIVSVILTEEIQNHQDPCISVPEVPPLARLGSMLMSSMLQSELCLIGVPPSIPLQSALHLIGVPTASPLQALCRHPPTSSLICVASVMSSKLQLVQQRSLCLWKIIANWQQELRVSLLSKTHTLLIKYLQRHSLPCPDGKEQKWNKQS